MTAGKEYYKSEIIDSAPVEVFMATNTAMLEYPYLLGNPDESSPTLASMADKYIMDSGIGDDSYSSREVFERAEEVGASHVVAPDVMHDTKATTEATVEMARMVADSDMELLISTQKDDRLSRYEHYCELKDALTDIGIDITERMVAIGGIRDIEMEDQIMEAVELRSSVGDDIHLHAFGCGMQHDWVVAIRKRPDLIDSLDTSSVGKYVTNGKAFDSTMEIREHKLPRGKNSTCISVMLREQIVYMFNYLIGPHVRETDTPTEFKSEMLQKQFSNESTIEQYI